MSTDSAIRASDTDREHVIEVLRDAYAAGRLTLAEFDERTTTAFAARTWGELRVLTDDLPGVLVPGPAGPLPVPGTEDPVRGTGARWEGQPRRRTMPVLPIALIWLAVTVAAHMPEAFIPIMIVLAVMLRTACHGRCGGGPGYPPGRDPSGRGGPA